MAYIPTLEDTVDVVHNSPLPDENSKITGSYQPTMEDTISAATSNPIQDIISQMTFSQKDEKKSGWQQIADFVVPPEVRKDLGKVGMDAALIGSGGISGMLGIGTRLGLGSAYGAASSPENRIKGAEEGLGFSALGEAAPFAIFGIGKVSELINPMKYANKLGNQIQNVYSTFKNKASGIYNGLRDKYKDNTIYEIGNKIPSIDYLKTPKDILKHVLENPTLREMHKDFIKNPSYKNAHELQSQMGSYIRSINGDVIDSNTKNTIDAVSKAQDRLQDDLGNFLKNSNKNDYNKYEDARDMTRDIISPHDSNKYIGNIARGRVENIEPNKLLKSIEKAKELGELPESHYLNEVGKQLYNRIKRGESINDIGSLIGGASIGEMMMPGGLGASAGLGAGAAMAKIVNPVAIRLAQNPYFVKGLSKLGKGYNVGRSYLLGEELNNQ